MPTIDRGPSTCWTEISANRRASHRDGWLLARWLELAVVVAFVLVVLVVLVGAVVQLAPAD